MRVSSVILERIHLDPAYALLSMQNIMTAIQIYGLLDVHASKCWNDVIFDFFLRGFTDLTPSEVQVLFNLLDVDQSGEIEFDEFYLLFSILIACKDQYEKEFIYRHSRSIFDLIDSDASGQISRNEFANMGILFNFDRRSVSSIFNEFDISGDKQLDFGEFRLFTMACIDEQRGIDAREKVNAFRDYNYRLMENLTPVVKRYIQSHNLPQPIEVEATVDATAPPFIVRRYYKSTVWRAIRKFFRKILECFKALLSLLCCGSNCCATCSCSTGGKNVNKRISSALSIEHLKERRHHRSCCCCCKSRNNRVGVDDAAAYKEKHKEMPNPRRNFDGHTPTLQDLLLAVENHGAQEKYRNSGENNFKVKKLD